jgi:threonyl-tRNA synthetase
MINITFPDKTSEQYSKGISALEIARLKGIADKVLVARINGELWDVTRPLTEDAEVELLTWENDEGKDTFWHSSSHLMAQTLELLYPGVKFGVGPSIENGFYYDIDPGSGNVLSENDFSKIEKKMLELARKKSDFIRKEVSKEEALRYFKEKNDQYKVELISELGDETITFYTQGEFTDLCRGPHLPHTGYIKAVKLLNVAGAYWRGDEHNPQLTRVYGVSFPNKEMLKEYLRLLEEAKKRDHRKVGKDLELFTFSDLVGKGFPLLLPKGATLRRTLERFVVDEELKRGYLHVHTPSLARKQIYEVSGHWELYKESMYPAMDIGNEDIVLRPMTCPHHFMIFNDKLRSYRDLPIRIAELASQYRKEQSGELSGLIRVLTFTLSDSHIFCRPDQVADEFKKVLEFIQFCMKCLGIDSAITYRASLRDDTKDKYVDNPEMWEQNEKFLLEILDNIGLEYKTCVGHAAFYGPKLDVQMKNILGKEDTVFTVQIDFALPERFDISYIDEHGRKQRPVVVHRSSIGSIERTMAFLIEYYGGAFPLWLAPIQVRILNITDRQLDYAQEVERQLLARSIRAETDLRNETLCKKLREARLQKIPYLLIIGDKEMEEHSVTVRNRDTGKQSNIVLTLFTNRVVDECKNFALELNAEKTEL